MPAPGTPLLVQLKREPTLYSINHDAALQDRFPELSFGRGSLAGNCWDDPTLGKRYKRECVDSEGHT